MISGVSMGYGGQAGAKKSANIAIVPPGYQNCQGRSCFVLPESSSMFENSKVSPELLVSMIEHDHKVETWRSGTVANTIPEIDRVFNALFIDEQQHTWRKLDHLYAPFADAPVDRRQVYIDYEGKRNTSVARSPVSRSQTVGDWSGEQVKRMKHDLEASLDLLDGALLLPKDLSPFNRLRTQEPPKLEQLKIEDNCNYANDGSPFAEVTKYRSPLSHRYSSRSDYSKSHTRFTQETKTHHKILNEWQSQHVSLKDSIEKAKKSDRRPHARHSWALPPAPSVGMDKPGAWTKLVVPSKSRTVMQNDLQIKRELDISIMDIFHSAAVAKEASEAREDGMELWRKGLHFSILRGGITSR